MREKVKEVENHQEELRRDTVNTEATAKKIASRKVGKSFLPLSVTNERNEVRQH